MWVNNAGTPQHHNTTGPQTTTILTEKNNRGSTSDGYYVCPNKLRNLTMTSQKAGQIITFTTRNGSKLRVGPRNLDPTCSKARGYNFEPERTTRKSNINHLERQFNLVHCRPSTQVVSVAYVHFHHHTTNSNMSTKKRKHNKSDNRNNKIGTRNADVDFQSDNEQLGDPNKNYVVKGVQKLDFHPPKAD
jgi:hypothetical protein